MFFPDRCVPLIDVWGACEDLAYEEYPAELSGGAPRAVLSNPQAELYTALLFDRFVCEREPEIWVYQFPDLLLRASSELFWREVMFSGPCPKTPVEAAEQLEFHKRGRYVFLTPGMRVNADLAPEFVEYWGLAESISSAKQLQGALCVWRPQEWPIEIEVVLKPLTDAIYYRGQRHLFGNRRQEIEAGRYRQVYEDFRLACPEGKEASGLSWSEIEQKTGWSPAHMRRAIAQFDNRKQKPGE